MCYRVRSGGLAALSRRAAHQEMATSRVPCPSPLRPSLAFSTLPLPAGYPGRLPMRFEGKADLLHLAVLLSGSREGIGIAQIQRDFGVSHRTAQRMLAAIRERFSDLEEVDGDERAVAAAEQCAQGADEGRA